MSDLNPSVGFSDLLSEEPESFVHESVNVRMGVAPSMDLPAVRQSSFKPNATRYMFNPFEIIDLRNLGASCGIHYLENIRFNKIESIATNVRKADPYDIAASPLLGESNHNDDNYQRFDRTSYMIARELEGHHGEKGVTEITALLGASEEEAADLSVLLFGETVTFISDINSPERPCPPLRDLLETLHENVTNKTRGMDEPTKRIVLSAAKQIRDAIGLAIRNARARTQEAHKRFLDPKNPNRMLSDAEQRCFLALGEEIPDTMPLISKGAFNNMQNPNAGLGREIVQGLVEAGVIGTGVVAAPAIPTTGEAEKAFNEIDFAVEFDDVEAAETVVPIKIGDEVTYQSKTATVTANQFGKLTIQYADGSTEKVTKDQLG